jgi:hypothetical protein
MFNFPGVGAQLLGNIQRKWNNETRGIFGKTNLENRFRIRPAGVLERLSIKRRKESGEGGKTHVSKKLIGDLKIAKAILSCSFLDACGRQQH